MVLQDKHKEKSQYMKNQINPNWLRAEVQACIDPPSINFDKKDHTEESHTNIIRVKIRLNPASAASETYKLKISTFKNFQSEEFLMLHNKSKTATDRTGAMTVAGRKNYLCMMICVEVLREFDKLASKNNFTTNSHLKHI